MNIKISCDTRITSLSMNKEMQQNEVQKEPENGGKKQVKVQWDRENEIRRYELMMVLL